MDSKNILRLTILNRMSFLVKKKDICIWRIQACIIYQRCLNREGRHTCPIRTHLIHVVFLYVVVFGTIINLVPWLTYSRVMLVNLDVRSAFPVILGRNCLS